MLDAKTSHKAPLEFLTIALHGDALYGVSKERGELFPLYVFGQLQQALLAGDTPPLAPSWQFYMREFVLQYIPAPALDHPHLPHELREDIRSQSRDSDPERGWPQMTYKLWPLYYFGHGLQGGEQPDRPLLFKHATLGLKRLYGPDTPGEAGEGEPPVTFPPSNLGP